MLAYIIRRLLAIAILVFGVSILVFLIIHLIPGDPVQQMLGTSAASASEIRNIRHQLGLDLPLPVQYLDWVGNVAHGNFGYSYIANTSVSSLITHNFPYTAELTLASLLVSLLIGIPLGSLAALTRGSVIDTGLMAIAVLALSLPSFWLALLLIALFSVQFHVFPVFGSNSLTSMSSLVLPSVALGSGVGGVTARFVRASVVEAARQKYVTTAYSKGLSRIRVFIRHIVRNAILPVVTVVGLQFGWLLSGTVVIEVVFSRPGVGALLVNSILDKDYLTAQALVLLLTIVYTVVNLLVDLLYPWIDPRIAY